jgi:hypothetical protein
MFSTDITAARNSLEKACAKGDFDLAWIQGGGAVVFWKYGCDSWYEQPIRIALKAYGEAAGVATFFGAVPERIADVSVISRPAFDHPHAIADGLLAVFAPAAARDA